MGLKLEERAGRQLRPLVRGRVRWTKAMRAAFLDHLAATCNVKASAAMAGVFPCAVYELRRREPRFAEAWGEALALGYVMLETLLVGQALAGDGGETLSTGVPPETGAIEVDLALRLLISHRNADGKPKPRGPRREFADPNDTDAALMNKLAQIEARRAKPKDGVAAAGRTAASDDAR